jgi:hypothetical protein
MSVYKCRVSPVLQNGTAEINDYNQDYNQEVDRILSNAILKFPQRVPGIGEGFRFQGYYYQISRIVWTPEDTNGIVAWLEATQIGAQALLSKGV